MYLERAQNSTKFSASARNRLAGVEQALFSQYKDDIPTSKRRFLHNLPLTPLVIVDTNVLVDALVEKMYQKMDLVYETNVNIIGSNQFHRILLHHAQAKQLVMMIPEDVRGELKQFAKDQRLMPRFKSAMVNAEKLEETLSESVMMGLVDDVLLQYNTWTPSSDMLDGVPDDSEGLNRFLLRHSDVFDELTELKGYAGPRIGPNSTDGRFIPRARTLISTDWQRTSRPFHFPTSEPWSLQPWTETSPWWTVPSKSGLASASPRITGR